MSGDQRRLSRQLILKKKLHLNLNVRADDNLMPKKKVQANDEEIQEEKENYVVFNYDDDDGKDNADLPQHQHQQQKSLLKSSPTALAKFNRIIDTTVPTTNVYQQEESVQTTKTTTTKKATAIALAYRNIVSTDSMSITETEIATETTSASATLAAATTTTSETITTLTLKTEMQNDAELESADDNNLYHQFYNNDNTDNNKMKRNDVHYLLKQLNSFSDIEEIEIVDNMQQQKKRQRQKEQQQQQQQQQNIELEQEKYSPTTQSLVLLSPSALSHKGIRRYASLHQQQDTTENVARDRVATSFSQQLPQTNAAQYYYATMATGIAGGGGSGGVQQFDDYLFQSCHYLETNYFAANYRTAMVESCSHEFRPSITTTTGTTSASYSSHSSLHTFDIHETEPPSVICKAPPSLPQPLPQPQPQPLPPPPSTEKLKHKEKQDLDVENIEADFEDNEQTVDEYDEDEEEQELLHPYVTHAQQPPALGPPPRRFQMQARLTSSGVQTELTASSLSTAATNASLAKSSTLSQHTTSTTSSTCRRKPFFKCCYTPIDRWRERRSAAAAAAALAAQQQQQQQEKEKRPTDIRSSSSDVAVSKRKDKEKEAAFGSAV